MNSIASSLDFTPRVSEGGAEQVAEKLLSAVILSIDSLSAAHDRQKLNSSLAVGCEACEAGEDAVRQAMTDAELVPSCPFLSLVPVF